VSSRRAEEVNQLFGWLNRIDNFDWVPPAILFLSQNMNNPDVLVQFYTDLERLAAGMMIIRVSLNDRLRRYAQLIAAIEAGQDLFDVESPLQLTSSECDDVLSTLNSDVYLLKPRLYILLRLDAVLADRGATYDNGVISVEHVLPQNPAQDSVWLQWFPRPEQRAHYTHRLGNLLLLSRKKNSSLQNKDFEQKKALYFSGKVANFALTNQVHGEYEWTPEVVERRQHTLLETLKRLWRL